MKRRPPEARVYLDEIVVDSFAGGGGASKGIEMALGRSPDIAINHDAEAIALHKANHPDSKHYTENVWAVDPKKATAGRPVGLMWLSPDCKHFSKAKGGRPVNKKIRGLAWVAIRWAASVKPRIIVLENVEEFQQWGPVLKSGVPCKRRKGQTFRAFVRKLEKCGYLVEWKEIRACDYGAPTIRKRLFLIARRDGQPIIWPKPTHGKGTPNPWRTAAECIQWERECPSIFDRKKALADNTLRRIARGIKKFVIDSPSPFIVSNMSQNVPRGIDEPMATITSGNKQYFAQPFITGLGGRMSQTLERGTDQPMQTICAKADSAVIVPSIARIGQTGGNGAYINDVREPLTTVTSKAEHLMVAPYLVPTAHQGDERAHSIEEPLRTICGGKRGDHALVAPVILRAAHGEQDASGKKRGKGEHPIDEPLGTVLASNEFGIIAPFLKPRYGERPAEDGRTGQEPRVRSVEDPMPVVVPTGNGGDLVATFLAKHFKESSENDTKASSLSDPCPTVLSTVHHSLVACHMAQHNTGEVGHPMEKPVSTIVQKGCTQALVASHLSHFHSSNVNGGQGDLFSPMRSIMAQGTHIAEVRAFLTTYYSTGLQDGDLNEPMHTVLSKERFGLVTVEGVEYAIADIGMRMLAPRELYRAQGFPDSYRIDIDYKGKPMTKTAQVRMCGNSVCPPLAAAIVAANYGAENAGAAVA